MAKASKSAEHKGLTPEEEAKQACILRDQNANEAYLFARNNPGADVEALQEVVSTWGSAWNTYWFALGIPGANIQALQEVILSQGTAYVVHLFARQVPGVDIRACARRIMALDPQDEEGLLRRLQEARPTILTPDVLAELSLGVTL